jgi:hypothetical protein
MASDLRQIVRTPGVGLVLLNLLGWAFTMIRSPRHIPVDAFFGQSTSSAMHFDQAHCWDCPAFRMLGREFFSYWDSAPVRVFLIANLPSLLIGRGPRDSLGTFELDPSIVFVASSLQWFLVARLWAGWQTRRKQTPAPVAST